MVAILRAVVGAIMSIVVGVFLLWYALPMLWTVYTQYTQNLDTSDPYLDQLVTMGNTQFQILGLVAFIVPAYLVFAYATESVPFDRMYRHSIKMPSLVSIVSFFTPSWHPRW